MIQVSTPSGDLRGLVSRSCENNAIYYAFKGIPYAKPPAGPLRFEDPEPIEQWTNVKDAVEHGSVALQFDIFKKTIVGSEDCLYLNVYTRGINNEEKLRPVLFYIHGGAFLYGSGNDTEYGPNYLMTKNVVLVTINYRLGIFGFLNTGSNVRPINQGLKDQVMALRWVRANIVSFGGDPDNVTIFGSSSGGASVHFLNLSPLGKGLFHKAIISNGCAFNPPAFKHEPENLLNKFLIHFEIDGSNSEEAFLNLKATDSHKLIEAQERFMTAKDWVRLDFPFGPGLDSETKNPFFPKNLSIALENGVQVPLIMGYDSLEASFILGPLLNIDFEDFDRNFENYVTPRFLKHIREDYDFGWEDLREFYFGEEKISEENLQKVVDFESEIIIVEGMHKVAAIQARSSGAPTYLYKFTYEKQESLGKTLLKTSVKGACHGDELLYLFKSKLFECLKIEQLREGTGSRKLMRQMVELWTNFAETGRPTPTTSELIPHYWKPLADGSVLRYFNIDVNLRMDKVLNIHERYSFE